MMTKAVSFIPLIMCLLCVSPSVALGQGAVALTDKQIELNNRVNAILRQSNPDLALARKLAKEALLEGERVDLLLLSLARVEQLDDQCHRATKLLNEIEVTPNDPSIPREAILKRRDAYSEQMASLCSGTLDIECADPKTQIRIGQSTHSCDVPIRVSPGLVSLTATLGNQSRTMEVELVGLETKRITISLVSPSKTTSSTSPPEPATDVTSSHSPRNQPDRRRTRLIILGSVLATGGAAVTTYSVVRAQQVQDGVNMGTISIETGLEQEQRINTMRAIGIPTAILGTAAIVYGVTSKANATSAASAPRTPQWTANVGQRSFTLHYNYRW